MTCIKMTGGNVYVVDLTIEEVVEELLAGDDEFVRISGSGERDDFYINVAQVSAVYPAAQEN